MNLCIQYDAVAAAYKQLEEELKHAKYPYGPTSDAPRSVDVSYFYSPANNMDTSGAGEQPMNVDVYGDAKLRKLANEDMFHLSPLPVNIPPLPSAIQGFSALAEDDDDIKGTRDKSMSYSQKSIVYDHTLPRSAIQPIPIPNKSHVPRVSSGLAITVPETFDPWESGTPPSFPQAYDFSMGGCSASPMAEPSIRGRPTPSQASELRVGGPSPTRQYLYNDGHREHGRERSPVGQWEHRRVQLHDLLGSQKSSSLPANSQPQSILSSEIRPPHSRSYSVQSVSQTPVPTNPSPTPSTSMKSSPSPILSQNHGNHHTANSTPRTAPLISHASSAAIQLERERLRAEKEREGNRDREQDRRQQGGSSSGSLRDTTNAHQRMGNLASGKPKTQLYA